MRRCCSSQSLIHRLAGKRSQLQWFYTVICAIYAFATGSLCGYSHVCIHKCKRGASYARPAIVAQRAGASGDLANSRPRSAAHRKRSSNAWVRFVYIHAYNIHMEYLLIYTWRRNPDVRLTDVSGAKLSPQLCVYHCHLFFFSNHWITGKRTEIIDRTMLITAPSNFALPHSLLNDYCVIRRIHWPFPILRISKINQLFYSR